MDSKIGAWLRKRSHSDEKDPETPIRSPIPRIKNAFSENWRGIIGTIPLLFLPIFLTELKTRPDNSVRVIWAAMFWLLLLQPVNVPVTGMVPIFAFPCLHVLSSDDVCTRFMNPTMVLFIVGGYVQMLLNNSGFDRRVILWLLSPKNVKLSSNSLVIRSSFAAFILSMFSNRLMVTSATMDYVTGPLINLQSTATERGSKTDYNAVRNIVCNAIATSSSIGSIAILNASNAALAMRTIWEMHGTTPDVFNFFQYSVFAFPVAVVMFLLNLVYHLVLLSVVVKTPMSLNSLESIRSELSEAKKKIPLNITLHEILSVFFLALTLFLYFFRWSEIIRKIGQHMGWADFRKLDKLNNPQIADATVSCLFAILLHIIPISYNFTKYFKCKLKKNELPPAKAETSVLLWRFVDKNTNYGYIILIGGGIALNIAVASSGLAKDLQENGNFITNQNWIFGIGLICFLCVVLCNVMTSVGAVIIMLPFVLNMAPPDTVWADRLHVCALAVGISCSFGYAVPFLYTPSYYMKETGKVPLLQQIKYAIGSAVICFIVLWIALCFYADPVFVGDTKMGTTEVPTSATKKY